MLGPSRFRFKLITSASPKFGLPPNQSSNWGPPGISARMDAVLSMFSMLNGQPFVSLPSYKICSESAFKKSFDVHEGSERDLETSDSPLPSCPLALVSRDWDQETLVTVHLG